MAELFHSLTKLAQLQGVPVDRLALQEAVQSADKVTSPQKRLLAISKSLHLPAPTWQNEPDPAFMPVLLHMPGNGWCLLRGQNAKGEWVGESFDTATQAWRERVISLAPGARVARINLRPSYEASQSRVLRIVLNEVLSHKKILFDMALGAVLINLLAVLTSLYSMQVYDRVVPTGASQTLMVLTLGVLAGIVFEWIAKHIRANLNERLVTAVDSRLARMVYMRFLAVRLDQMPRSVGSLAAQMRGYEAVRGYIALLVGYLLFDGPFALFFLAIMAMLAGNLAYIPLVFLILALAVGLYYHKRVELHAIKVTQAANFKTGLLVESVEGAETIKSGQAGWRMLARWLNVTDEARNSETEMRHTTESAQFITATFQQISYVLIVAFGALIISRGELTMGGLLACSILSGRVFAPVALVPNLLVQWANTKASLKGLDALWALEDDHAGEAHPVVLDKVKGKYQLDDVKVSYAGRTALSVPNLVIQAGEKVAILGPVGSGKTTLLRLLSGMYKPQTGRLLLDDMDIAHVSKPTLAEHIGYLQQDGRLFAGSLRDNLILGLIDPGDEAILAVAQLTGLQASVIASHPKGLQQEIYEGGTGLSGGQRQLVNLTRVFLRKPTIWLLDEPTASIDRQMESRVQQALRTTLTPAMTLVLVTHKMEMLEGIDRLVIVANNQVVMDGPKAAVLQRLQAADQATTAQNGGTAGAAAPIPAVVHARANTVGQRGSV